MTRRQPLTLTALALAALLLASVTATAQPLNDLPAPKLDGRTLTTARHQITLGDSGLPAQIAIQAAAYELPLEMRNKPADVPAELLSELGRGNQLQNPIELRATAGGGEQAAEVTTAARPQVADGKVTAQSKLTAGNVKATLDVTYAADGALLGTLSYSGNNKADELALVIPLSGPVDVAIPGNPVGGDVDASAPVGFNGGTGVVWGNSADDAGDNGRAAPGKLTHLFVGSGDRGFTVLTDGGDGWQIDPGKSMAVVERDDQGRYTLRIRVINHSVDLGGSKRVTFALLTHPATTRPDNFRDKQWTAEPRADAATPALKLQTRTAAKAFDVLRADAVALESLSDQVRLTGPAGVALPNNARDVASAYNLPLYRYLSATHTGLMAQIAADNLKLTSPGGDPAPDRMILGRALLHDSGVDIRGLANATQSMELMNKLVRFGLFNEEQVEFIPYWRNDNLLRYGPAFSSDDPFALTRDNPYRLVKVSAYRTPLQGGGHKTILIVANEGDQPVRDVLHILNSDRVFGGLNAMTGGQIAQRNIDFSKLPDQADWGPRNLMGGLNHNGPALEDMETGAVIAAVKHRNQRGHSKVEYGRLFIPPHDFRVLVGYSKK